MVIKTKKAAILDMAKELKEIRLLLQKYIEGKGY